MAKELEEDDIVIGTVSRIIGTSVFVKLDAEHEGVINFSEVAPGRIRNIRDYINPEQRIVVKILRIDHERMHFDLSLRRVTLKEKKETLENEKKEKEILTLLKIVTKDDAKAKESFDKIKAKMEIAEIFEKFAKAEAVESMFNAIGLSDTEAKTLFSMLKEKIKEKKVEIKVDFSLHSDGENGIDKIRKILAFSEKNIIIKYLGTPLYSITVVDKDYKEANRRIRALTEQLAQRAKAESFIFEIKSQT